MVAACGTAYHAGLVAKYAIEHWTCIPVEVELASEFRYRDPILGPADAHVAISQSGETMDTLMAVWHAREQGSRLLSICNTLGFHDPAGSDAALYTYAGPEIAVASTRRSSPNWSRPSLLGMYLRQVPGTCSGTRSGRWSPDPASMPNKIDLVLDTMDPVLNSRAGSRDANLLFLGRHVGYPVASRRAETGALSHARRGIPRPAS